MAWAGVEARRWHWGRAERSAPTGRWFAQRVSLSRWEKAGMRVAAHSGNNHLLDGVGFVEPHFVL
jgi:hypothetical protein